MTPKQQKLLIVASSALVAILLLALVIIPAFQHRGKVRLQVIVVPKDSALFLDNKKIKPGTVYVSKGKHTFKATRPDFTDAIKAIDTATLNTKDPVYVLPKPSSQKAFDYLENHDEEQETREAAESVIVAKQQDALTKYPILSKLPYTAAGFEYIIDYDSETNDNGDVKVTITIQANDETGRQDALQWIRDQGTKPETLNIEYTANLQQDDPNIGHQ